MFIYIYIYIYISTPYTCATFQHRYGIFLLCFLIKNKISVTLFFYLLHAFFSLCSRVWIGILLNVNFLLRKIFLADLNEAMSLVEIAAFRFPWKIFLNENLTFRLLLLTFFRRRTRFKWQYLATQETKIFSNCRSSR